MHPCYAWEKKVKVINVPAPVKKGLTKLKSTSKPKSATPRPPIDATPANRTRGSKRKITPHPALAIERRVHHFLLFFVLQIRISFLLSLWLNLTRLLTSFFDSVSCSPFPLQSKHKEDTSATHPIVLNEPEFEVHFLIH